LVRSTITVKVTHDVWWNPGTGEKVTVPWKIMSRHTANGILNHAGLPEAW